MHVKKKIVIIAALFVFVSVSIYLTINVIGNIRQEEAEKNFKEAKIVIDDIVNLNEEGAILSSDYYGYIVIFEKGEKLKDVLYVVGKDGSLEDGMMVDFDYPKMTLKNSENKDVLLYAPNGNQYIISEFKLFTQKDYSDKNMYVFYGDESMGYLTEITHETTDENNQNNQDDGDENITQITKKAEDALNEYYLGLSTLAENDNIDSVDDIYGYVFIVECGDGFKDYLFIVTEDGTFSQPVKVNYNYEYDFSLADNVCSLKNEDGSDFVIIGPDNNGYVISDYEENCEVSTSDFYVKIFHGTEDQGFNVLKFDEPEEPENQLHE